MMADIRLLALVLLWVALIAQTLFVIRYYRGKGWRDDFVGRALMFKSTAVEVKLLADMLLWTVVPERVDYIPTWLLVSIIFSDIFLALGCTWQYTALERQKREDRSDGTEMGRDRDALLD